MSHLQIFHAGDAAGSAPRESFRDPTQIRDSLGERGIGFERWSARVEIPAEATEAEILEAYAPEITRVQASGRFPTVDAIRLRPDHPEREGLRRKFLDEHTHGEDEVRFFVEGQGLFCLHIGEEVLLMLCETNDFLRVPAGIRHWFDMGSAPCFTAIRFFDNPEGWVAQFTGDPISNRFPLLD
jgi:1,2-dihydroxy-3-keto-5-methylthiopentene dioxygenase